MHSTGRTYDHKSARASGDFFRSKSMHNAMSPKNVIRECVNTPEHPNTVPVILALDVTGSMGNACRETAQALSKIIKTLYNRFKDVEVMIMGIGDLECDSAPLQVGQYESDVRIAENIDSIYIEGGGGGNGYESYTAAWYFGLRNTKLDCFDKQGRKGIIITMGDEPMNPVLTRSDIREYLGNSEEKDIDSHELYAKASEKFDIYHIAVDDPHDCYRSYRAEIERTFGQMLGNRLIVSTIPELSDKICECVAASIEGNQPGVLNEQNGGLPIVSW